MTGRPVVLSMATFPSHRSPWTRTGCKDLPCVFSGLRSRGMTLSNRCCRSCLISSSGLWVRSSMSNAWARHPEKDSSKLSRCAKTNGFCPPYTLYGSPNWPSLEVPLSCISTTSFTNVSGGGSSSKISTNGTRNRSHARHRKHPMLGVLGQARVLRCRGAPSTCTRNVTCLCPD